LRRANGISNALRILGVGQLCSADGLDVEVFGGSGVRSVDGKMGDTGDFGPGRGALGGGCEGEGGKKSGGKEPWIHGTPQEIVPDNDKSISIAAQTGRNRITE
jgi:hypothetical protein